MRLNKIVFKLRHSIAQRGVLQSATVALKQSWTHLRSGEPSVKTVPEQHYFDAQHGTDTGGFVQPDELRSHAGTNSVYNNAYYGVPPSLFKRALDLLALDESRFTFVDLGAGKGRALLLACDRPFKKVIGVEYSRDLQEIAQANLLSYEPVTRVCRNAECVVADARDFVFPPEDLVVFMWNPFSGSVFNAVISKLERIVQATPQKLYIVYLSPDCRDRLDKSPRFEKVVERRLEMSEEDRRLYRFDTGTELCVVYKCKGERGWRVRERFWVCV